jgi:hypothetical protein
MVKDLSYNDIFLIHQDLKSLKQTHPGIALLQENRIKKFYQANAIVLKDVNDGMFALQKQFVVLDEQNRPVYADAEPGTQRNFKYLDMAQADGATISGEMV